MVFAWVLAVASAVSCGEVQRAGAAQDAGSETSPRAAAERRVIVTDQESQTLRVFDLSRSPHTRDSALWAGAFKSHAADARVRRFNGKELVLNAFNWTEASILDYTTKATVWQTRKTGNNPHAIELTPDGVIAVAASDGGDVRFYRFDDPSGEPFATMPLTEGHGVLWDPTLGVLWACGGETLTAYTITRDDAAPGGYTVAERADLRFALGTKFQAHDLQPFFGDRDRLWITGHCGGAFVYSKSRRKLEQDPAWPADLRTAHVKGVGNFRDGVIVYIYPDKGRKPGWRSRHIRTARKTADGTYTTEALTFPDCDFYKVHILSTDYQ